MTAIKETYKTHLSTMVHPHINKFGGKKVALQLAAVSFGLNLKMIFSST